MKDMQYSQSICAQNLLTSLWKFDKLVSDGMNYIHLDFMDFMYTASFGLNIEQARFLKKRFPWIAFDAHIMTSDPYKVIKKLDFVDIAFIPVKKWNQHKNQQINSNIKICPQFVAADDINDYLHIIRQVEYALIMTIDKIGGTGELLNKVLCQTSLQVKAINPSIKTFADGGLRQNNIQEFKINSFDVVVGGSIINDFIKSKNFINWFKEQQNV